MDTGTIPVCLFFGVSRSRGPWTMDLKCQVIRPNTEILFSVCTLGHSHWWTPRYYWDIKKWTLDVKFLYSFFFSRASPNWGHSPNYTSIVIYKFLRSSVHILDPASKARDFNMRQFAPKILRKNFPKTRINFNKMNSQKCHKMVLLGRTQHSTWTIRTVGIVSSVHSQPIVGRTVQMFYDGTTHGGFDLFKEYNFQESRF